MINSICKTLFGKPVLAGIALLVMGMLSCKKEYVDRINTIPGDTTRVSGMNYIKTFEINEYSADTVIKAGITADSIVISWPSYFRKMPDSISPVITLPDSAKITPASGSKVAFKTGTTYTVTSAAGTNKKYILIVNQQSAVPWFYYNTPTITLGDYVALNGDQFWQDTSKTKVYLVSATTGTEYLTELFSVANSGPRFIVPVNIPPTGLYDIKVVNGDFTLYNSTEKRRNAISLVYPTALNMNPAGLPSKLARGSEFTLRGTLLSNVVSASLYAGGVYTPIDFVSAATDRVVLRIPAGMALGTYIRIRVTTADGVSRIMTGISITVTQ